MIYRNIAMTAAVLFLAVAAPVSSMAKTFFVQPPSVKVMAAPSFGSAVLGTVSSGYRFDSTGTSGRWLALSFKGGTGYINVSQALETPPVGTTVKLTSQGTPKLSPRDRTSSVVAVAGVKGLTYEDRSRASSRNRADYEALEKMEGFKVRPEEVQAFQAGGNR